MIVSPLLGPNLATVPQRRTEHFCPHCLRRVPAMDAQRQAHREACASGEIEIDLLQCPACGLVLAAEVQEPTDLYAALPAA